MRRAAVLIATIACLLGLDATTAGAFSASVRWRAPAGPVAGYRIYHRAAGASYGTPLNAGSPQPAADGTMRTVVGGLDDATNYFFSLTAVGTNGLESPHSNEIAVAGPDAPPLSPATGACGALGPVEPLIKRFVFRPTRKPVLAVRGTFPADAGTDPTVDGAIVELHGAAGELLYRSSIAASLFKVNSQHTSFGFFVRPKVGAPAETEGLTRLLIRRGAVAARVTIAATAPELVDAAGQGQVTLVMRVGSTCVLAPDLVCTTAPSRTACE